MKSRKSGTTSRKWMSKPSNNHKQNRPSRPKYQGERGGFFMTGWKRWVLPVVAVLVMVSAVALNVLGEGEDPVSEDPFEPLPVPESEGDPVRYADIQGAVRNPGVYRIEEGLRLFQIIDYAGGLRSDADVRGLSLARRLQDEEQVWIPFEGEREHELKEPGGVDDDGPLCINTASEEALRSLPNVGPATASAIVVYREENGRFETVEGLLEVSNIGEATLEQLRPLITV